ncbi:MAG TPA: RecX family transcriptional regulator [Candidatus Saccharimonadia bacterium]|nr:RecX family transcriptional regulator [Candidatus Saccharimonadia bacterium]
MPVVTAIKRKSRLRGAVLFRVFIDEVFAFSLSDLELSNSGIRVGQELSEGQIGEFRAEAKESKAYALALRYLGVRMRSRRELADYLAGKGCEPAEIEVAIGRLEGLGLVDDLRFGRAWIADRQAVRPRSRLRLAQELAAKGVARDIAEVALRDMAPESELESLKQLIQRKRRLSGYADERKLTAYLQRQGYRWDLIKEALEVSSELD